MVNIVYQTVENRDENIDYVESNGPFICTSHRAWLGEGYYFWDSHIELAHWWGNVRYEKNQLDYLICRSIIYRNEKCYDLHGEGKFRIEFAEAISEMKKARLYKNHVTTVSKVIEFLKKRNEFKKKYDSIRVLGTESVRNFYNKELNLKFETNKKVKTFLDLNPPVQFCLFDRKAQNIEGYNVIYPEYYAEGYML